MLQTVNPNASKIQEGRMTINSQLAQDILQDMQFERQRTLNMGHVRALTDIMIQGDWQSGHAIHFASLGGKFILVDGQHRLSAIIASGRKQEFQVVVHKRQTEQEVALLFCSFDTNNRKRSAGDILQANGTTFHYGITQTMAQRFYEAAYLVESDFVRVGHIAPDSKNIRRRLECVERWANEARLYQDSIRGADKHLKQKLHASGCVAVGLATFRYQRELAEQFWGRVADGEGLSKGDPRMALAYDLRNRYLSSGALSLAEYVCSIAWNAFFLKGKRKIIKIAPNSRFSILGTPWGKR